MESVLVIGAGYMGTGIAQVCAQAGYGVHLCDIAASALDKALGEMEWSLKKLGQKGLLKDSPDAVMERVTAEHDLKSAATAKLVIEAVPEKEALKLEIFRKLEGEAAPETILATNTSSIPVSRIAKATRSPERVVGIHFFGPVPLMDLVEVVKGEKTSQGVFQRSMAFVKSLGKTPVAVNRDIPGFVMNRIMSAAFREAVDLATDGVATLEDIDTGMKLGYGWRAGPFEIVDNAGLDIWSLVWQFFKNEGETQLISHSGMIEQMIKAGRLGRKTGKGFYRYSPEGKREPWHS